MTSTVPVRWVSPTGFVAETKSPGGEIEGSRTRIVVPVDTAKRYAFRIVEDEDLRRIFAKAAPSCSAAQFSSLVD